MATLTPEQKAYNRGARESVKPRTCDGWDCPCTITYWERRLSGTPTLDAFLDGWSDAASGTTETRDRYFPKEN